MRHFSSLSRPFAYLMIATVLCWQASALLGPQVAHATSDTIYEGTNTTLSGDDDYSGPFNFGFNFPFFGVTKTQAFVNINGTLNFDSGYDEYSNSGLPAGSGMGAAILPFWDDLITHNYDAQSILYKTVGSAPNREFIVQWTSMYFYNNPDVQLGTFQVILYENGGKIQLQYRDILGGTQAEGDSATIGIQKDGSTPLQYSVNDPVVHSRMAISYTPDEDTYIINDAAAYDYKYLSDADGPGTATLTSPSNAATGVSTSPTLTWSAATNTTSYKVLVATDAGFSTIVTNQSGVTDTSYGLSGLDPGTTYYWRIEADNSSGSALSDSFSFTTGAANQNPTDPTSLSPSTLTGSSFISQSTLAGTPFAFTLADPDSGQQVKYQIQINSSNDFASPLISYTSALAAQGASTFTFGQAAGSGTYTVGSASTTLSDGNYYWRVRTIDDATAVSGWSAPSGIAFKLDTTAPALGTVTATNSGSTATFSWDTATDAGSGLSATPYTLQYSKSSDFSSGVTTVSQAETTYSHTLKDGTWYVRVKAADVAGNISAYSTATLSIVPVLAVKTVDQKETAGDPVITALPTFSGNATPGTEITVTVHSNPVTCTATADADGHWSCTLATSLPGGQHTVLISALTPGGTPISLASFPVTVPAQLAGTGSPVQPILFIGGLLLALGLRLLFKHD